VLFRGPGVGGSRLGRDAAIVIPRGLDDVRCGGHSGLGRLGPRSSFSDGFCLCRLEQLGRRGLLVLAVLALGEVELLLAEVRVVEYVADVEEGRLLEAHVYESGLHPGEHPDHAALVDVADDAPVALAIEVVLRDGTVLDECHARLAARGVDHQDVIRHVD
jgi:hypothetical protein